MVGWLKGFEGFEKGLKRVEGFPKSEIVNQKNTNIQMAGKIRGLDGRLILINAFGSSDGGA